MARSKPEVQEIKEWARVMKNDLAHNGMFIMIKSLLERIDQLETENSSLKLLLISNLLCSEIDK